jgi:hypothetical protein
MTICEKCTSEVSETEEKCSTCGEYAGPPNVRAADQGTEVQALEIRYLEAINRARADGREQELLSFDLNIKLTFAVVNVDLAFLHQFLTDDKLTYSNYDLSIKGQTRRPAKGRDDRHRKSVGAMLFGSYAEEIRYAALSLDGSGLMSWGPYAIRIKELAIGDRVSLLEDNSYNFVAKHKLTPGGQIPEGYVTAWQNRHKLAVAKLGGQVSTGTTEAAHPRILLTSTGNRATDDFIEVHIYGGFDNKAIESVKGRSAVKGKYEQAVISIVKDLLTNAGKSWIEG